MNVSDILSDLSNILNNSSHSNEDILAKFASKLPRPDKTYVWDPKQLLFDESKLKDVLDCMEKPVQAAGSLVGHIIPGVIIFFMNFYMSWAMFSRYYKSTAPGSRYKFNGITARIALPNGWPLADVILAIYVPYLTSSEYLTVKIMQLVVSFSNCPVI